MPCSAPCNGTPVVRAVSQLPQGTALPAHGQLPVVLLPHIAHEGLIGHLLGEDMLEGVCEGSGGVSLIEKLSSLEVPEISVHSVLRHVGHSLQQRQGDVFTNDCGNMQEALGGGL